MVAKAAEVRDIDNRVIWLTRSDEVGFFDRQAKALLGISGDEFRRRLEAGDFADNVDGLDHSDLMYLALLAGVAR